MANLLKKHVAAASGCGSVITGLLLDTHSAYHAFSFRKLVTGATNSCRVRRSSDDAETNVVLHASNSLTLSSTVTAGGDLTTWAGSDDVFIVTMFDQGTAGYDYTQSTKSRQGKILNAGALLTVNGLAASLWDDTDRLEGTKVERIGSFNAFGVFNMVNENLINYVAHDSASGEGIGIGGTSASFGAIMVYENGASRRVGVIQDNTGQHLFDWGETALYIDCVESTPYTASDTPASISYSAVFGRTIDNFGLDGYFQEWIFYNSDKTADRGDIATTINDFYSIF